MTNINYKEVLKNFIDVLILYELRHDNLDTANINSDDKLYGLCDSYRKTIHINKYQSLKEARDTVVHEILHAYDDSKSGYMRGESEIEKITNELIKDLYGCNRKKPRK